MKLELFPENKIRMTFASPLCIIHHKTQKNLHDLFTLYPVTLTNQHRHETHNNYKIKLEQVEANQATMRTDISAIQEKMDQLLETMLAISQRERVAEAEVGMSKNDSHISTSGLVNHDESFTHAKKSFIHISVGNKGDEDHVEPSDASTQHGSEVGGDDPYDAFYILDPPKPKVLPDPVAERLCALEKKIKAIEGNNIFGSASMNMRLVSNLVIPTKFKTLDFDKYKD